MSLGQQYRKEYEWHDTTSYSQGDKERKPSCWTYYTTHMRIVMWISRYWKKEQEEPKWSWSCQEIDVDEGVAGPSTLSEEDAKLAVLNKVSLAISLMLNDIVRMSEVEKGKVKKPSPDGE